MTDVTVTDYREQQICHVPSQNVKPLRLHGRIPIRLTRAMLTEHAAGTQAQLVYNGGSLHRNAAALPRYNCSGWSARGQLHLKPILVPHPTNSVWIFQTSIPSYFEGIFVVLCVVLHFASHFFFFFEQLLSSLPASTFWDLIRMFLLYPIFFFPSASCSPIKLKVSAQAPVNPSGVPAMSAAWAGVELLSYCPKLHTQQSHLYTVESCLILSHVPNAFHPTHGA